MSVTISELYTYIKTYRIGLENNRFATNNKDSVGETAVQVSLTWASKGFYKSDRATDSDWDEFESALFSDCNVNDLHNYNSLKIKLTREQLIIFEAIINYSLYGIYAHNDAENVGNDKKETAINFLGSIVGRAALDLTALSDEEEGGGINSNAIVVTDTVDLTAIETFIGNFKVY